jgi:GAF domain-containing protein
MAQQCAQALERTRLYDAERTARAAAERAQRRLAFLAEASVVLASSLDYETTLRNVAILAVPQFADWCAVHLIEDGSLTQLGLAYAQTEKREVMPEIRARHSESQDGERAIERVIGTGEPAFYPDITDTALRNLARDDSHLELFRRLEVTSGIVVPLKAHQQVLGTMTFVSAESDKHYSPQDLALAEELARRAALAVENARLYRASQRSQEELRQANEAKDEFLSMVSHEMRTSITTIYGGASILRLRGAQLDDDTKSEGWTSGGRGPSSAHNYRHVYAGEGVGARRQEPCS